MEKSWGLKSNWSDNSLSLSAGMTSSLCHHFLIGKMGVAILNFPSGLWDWRYHVKTPKTVWEIKSVNQMLYDCFYLYYLFYSWTDTHINFTSLGTGWWSTKAPENAQKSLSDILTNCLYFLPSACSFFTLKFGSLLKCKHIKKINPLSFQWIFLRWVEIPETFSMEFD